MKLVWRLIKAASVIFVLVMIAGWIASLWLPDRSATNFETACYWTDAMLVFVRCGDGAWIGWLREPIYNLFLTMFHLPLGLGLVVSGNVYGALFLISGFASWAALAITGKAIWAGFRRFTSARRSPT